MTPSTTATATRTIRPLRWRLCGPLAVPARGRSFCARPTAALFPREAPPSSGRPRPHPPGGGGRAALQPVPSGKLGQLTEMSRYIAEIVIIAPDDHQPFVGRSAFAHKGGV